MDKESASQCRRCTRCGFNPWVGKIPWRRNGNPFQYPYLKNPMDRGAWQPTVHRVPESNMTEHTCASGVQKRCRHRDMKLSACRQYIHPSVHFSSVTQLCPALCNRMNHSTPGLPVHHQLPEFTQTHVHRVDDAIQQAHPLLSTSSPAPESLPASGSFPMSQIFT